MVQAFLRLPRLARSLETGLRTWKLVGVVSEVAEKGSLPMAQNTRKRVQQVKHREHTPNDIENDA